jgi:serine/threonine-protein kinase
MLAGSPPFTGATQTAVLARQISEPPPPLRTVRPDVPPALEQVITEALAKQPERRYDASGFSAVLVRATK